MSRYIIEVVYLERPKRPINWNKGSTDLEQDITIYVSYVVPRWVTVTRGVHSYLLEFLIFFLAELHMD